MVTLALRNLWEEREVCSASLGESQFGVFNIGLLKLTVYRSLKVKMTPESGIEVVFFLLVAGVAEGL